MFVKTPNHGTLNLREKPNASGKVLAQIPDGAELECTIVNNDWAQIKYNGYNGYSKREFLSSGSGSITKENLKRIYDSLSDTLKLIDEVLKK